MTTPRTKIVILGGTAGIGLATAHAAARDGADVVVASSTQARVDAALATLPASATGHAVDLRDPAAVAALFARIGAFDHLVYTAGEALAIGAVRDLDLVAARTFFELRYFGALSAVKLAVPHIRSGGSIVLSSGAASRRPHPGFALIASVCGAMEGLTRALAVELAPIRVNLVVPGLVESDLWAGMSAEQRDGMYRGAAASLPVRHVGQPAEIAEAYLFFTRCTYATGQSVVVDGGAVLV